MSRSKAIAEECTSWLHTATPRVDPASHRAPTPLPRDGRQAVKFDAAPDGTERIQTDVSWRRRATTAARRASPHSRGSDKASHTNVAATRVQLNRHGPRRSPIAQATATGVEFPVERHPPASAEHPDWGMSYAFAS